MVCLSGVTSMIVVCCSDDETVLLSTVALTESKLAPLTPVDITDWDIIGGPSGRVTIACGSAEGRRAGGILPGCFILFNLICVSGINLAMTYSY